MVTGKLTVSSRLRDAQDLAQAGIEVELLGRVIELLLGDRPDVRSVGDRVLGSHRLVDCLQS